MTRALHTIQEHFRVHGQWFAEARVALDLDLYDRLVPLAEQMLSEGHRMMRDFYDALERGEVETIREGAGPGVRAWREAAGVSQREVAAYIGIDPGNLSRFERTLNDPANSVSPSLEAALKMAVLILLLADPKAPLGGVESEPVEGPLPLPVLGNTASELRAAAAKLPAPSRDLHHLIAEKLDRGDVGLAEQRLILALLRRPDWAAALLAHLQSDELEDLRQALRGPSLKHLFDKLGQQPGSANDGS